MTWHDVLKIVNEYNIRTCKVTSNFVVWSDIRIWRAAKRLVLWGRKENTLGKFFSWWQSSFIQFTVVVFFSGWSLASWKKKNLFRGVYFLHGRSNNFLLHLKCGIFSHKSSILMTGIETNRQMANILDSKVMQLSLKDVTYTRNYIKLAPVLWISIPKTDSIEWKRHRSDPYCLPILLPV